MKVTVLGATGNLGTAVVRRLADEPAVTGVVGVARRRPLGTTETTDTTDTTDATGVGGASVEWRTADVRHADWPSLLDDSDAVVDLAWMFQPTRRPEVTWSTNITGFDELLRSLPDTRVSHVVATSSIAAYSPNASATPVDESWPTHGASAATYAREKAYLERLLDAAERPGLTISRLRPAFVFQRRSASEQRRIFGGRLLPQRAVRPALVPAIPVPRGLQLQTVHADDVADAVARILRTRAAGPFNLCADDVLRAHDLAAAFEAREIDVPPGLARTALAAAWRLRAAPVPPSLYDALLNVPLMSNHRARHELGWEPQFSAAATFRELLAGLRAGAGDATEPLAPA